MKHLCANDSAGSRVKVGHRQATSNPVNPLAEMLGGFGFLEVELRDFHGANMIARLQQVITLSLLFVAALAVFVSTHEAHTGWGVVGSLIVLFGHAIFLGIEFFLLVIVTWNSPGLRFGALAMMRAWLGESLQAPRVFYWRQPFRSEKWPNRLPVVPVPQRGVILVHGLLCNRGFWNPWMAKLHACGTPFIAVNLEPISGVIDGDVASVDAAVATITRSTLQPPLLVGHSRGGLVLRAWAAQPQNVKRFHRIVTIGTPHSGTWMARFATSRSGAEMRPDSAWLTSLRALESAGAYARFTCFFSRCDNIVFPATTATLSGADNRDVPANAHIRMVFAPEVFDEVQRLLTNDTAGPAQV